MFDKVFSLFLIFEYFRNPSHKLKKIILQSHVWDFVNIIKALEKTIPMKIEKVCSKNEKSELKDTIMKIVVYFLFD